MAGQRTEAFFWQKLEEADGIILLLSSDFLAEERFEKIAQFLLKVKMSVFSMPQPFLPPIIPTVQ